MVIHHHPAFSDFIIAVKKDIDKQLDNYRSLKNHLERPRDPKSIIKEEAIKQTLAEAKLDQDAGIVLTMLDLGIQLKGAIEKMFLRKPNNEDSAEDDEHSAEEDEDSAEEAEIDVENIE